MIYEGEYRGRIPPKKSTLFARARLDCVSCSIHSLQRLITNMQLCFDELEQHPVALIYCCQDDLRIDSPLRSKDLTSNVGLGHQRKEQQRVSRVVTVKAITKLARPRMEDLFDEVDSVPGNLEIL